MAKKTMFLIIFSLFTIVISRCYKLSPDLTILTDHLRDITKFPLEPGESGVISNREPDKCNNFNDRKPNTTLKYIIQHHTVCNYSETVNIFLNQTTSAHFVIRKSGLVQEFVSPNFRAYHAGNGNLTFGSKLNPENLNGDMNSWAIGIETVNNGKEPYPFVQIHANLLLCDKLCDEIPSLDPNLMIGHSDWAIGRKIDVSVYFPWELFSKAKEESKQWDFPIKRNFGVFPRIAQLNLSKNPEPIIIEGNYSKTISQNKIIEIQKLLQMYGYSIDDSEIGDFGVSTQNAILAYNIHFKGQEIVKDKLEIWNKLVDGDTDPHVRETLIEFNENDLICLKDVLEQFPKEKLRNVA